MKPMRLRTKLSLAFLLIALFSFALIGLFANGLLGRQFERYTLDKLDRTIESTVSQVTELYSPSDDAWNAMALDTAGMSLLTNGLILRVTDESGAVVWDARTHNNGMCMLILQNMAQNMQSYQSNFQGGYEEQSFSAVVNGKTVGTVVVGYYGPFYYSDADLQFLGELNRLLLLAAAISLVACLLLGAYLARRLTRPMEHMIRASNQIAAGDYGARIAPSSTTEIDALAHSVNQLATSLEAQSTLRKRLTADVAHELRTPLASLQSAVEAMLDGVWDANEEHLTSCREEVLRLSRLVDELGMLSRYDGAPLSMEYELLELSELVRRVSAGLEPSFRQKGVLFQIEGGEVWLSADRGKLTQVLLNLLSNALKFTPEGGTITVSMNETEQTAAFTVSDTGDGIAPEDLPYIFERFYRADPSRSRATGGSGIGLSIVEAIVKAHGGTVSVSSVPGEGSAFTVTLPKQTSNQNS
jgi:heavy metal sensor kinase